MSFQPESDSALLVVDVQNDFCPGGSLAVSGGNEIVPVANELMSTFSEAGQPVIVTRDWHPSRTTHFQQYGGVWPEHCVQGSTGAEFHPSLSIPPGSIVVSKGMGAEEDSYSAFDARDESGRTVPELIADLGVNQLYIGGLATDYCVKFSVLDARKSGLRVVVLKNAIRGVELQPGDSGRAIVEMETAGAAIR